ncbi:MAG: hypothetical protein K2P80_15915 [Beijerinckiaceae bacterium]|nr:hypothetical protein [Beijerinckiaceae bacterium]
MKSSHIAMLAAFGLGLAVAGADSAAAAPAGGQRVAACDKFNRCVSRDGKYLQVIVRNRRSRVDDYDYTRTPTFEVAGFERPTLRYGNTGFIGQGVYYGYGGFRTQLGSPSFDNLR